MFITRFLSVCGVCANLVLIVMTSPVPTSNEAVENEVITYDFPFVTRAQWQARPAIKKLPLRGPMPFVVIHHSYTPPACSDSLGCSLAMRSMQNFHIDERKWWDIGYNFAVGGDGAAYEGRGWTTQGAHSLNFNNVSIGICLIGDWSKLYRCHANTQFTHQRYLGELKQIDSLPPVNQMKTAQALIDAGVEMGYLKPDYKLVGHRQVRETECPGNTLFEEIKHWKHFSPYPASAEDLANMDVFVS